MLRRVSRVARRELAAFFSSPAAFIFFGAFLAVTLFIFFWLETFFSRNIADVRPLFEWMPLLMVFLCSALTMRMWSEEMRMGTLELLLTRPVSLVELVLGKFCACLALVAVALALTFFIPISVARLGHLDWGPVAAGYAASLFLAAAYIAAGLYLSSKSDNQIVSLISSVFVCGLFYLIGSEALTSLFGNRVGEILKLAGSGSRFKSITRGVLDLRDLYYYLSVSGIFLTLNVFSLEKLGWASGGAASVSHRRRCLVTILFAANLLIGNVWLQDVGWARVDVTRGRLYSISDATRSYLAQLDEPLLIRGYFSAKTHPLLAPLVPQLRDLIREYQVAGKGRIRAEFVDPAKNPELEKEAGEKYGIKPVPFQVSDKYQESLVNSYFNILVKYGDQYEVLGFRDLIEVKAQNEAKLDVALRNPEYDITRAIKKALYAYRSGGDLFTGMKEPVRLRGYFSPAAKLPESLAAFRKETFLLLEEIKGKSGGRFDYTLEDPDANGGGVARFISRTYGLRPMRAGLFNPRRFYFYLLLESGTRVVQVPIPGDLKKEALRRNLEAALKRFSAGYLKTIAFCAPPGAPRNPYMRHAGMGGDKRFKLLRQKLSEGHTVVATDLKDGRVPDAADMLIVVAPKKFDDKQRFALDQFLMKGGTLLLAASPYEVSSDLGGLSASKHETGLEDWLSHYGVSLGNAMVLDPRSEHMAVPIERNLGGFIIREMRMVEYPYFPDVRAEGMSGRNTPASGLSQVTLNWPSPIVVDPDKNKGRTLTRLLQSSPESWTSRSLAIIPNFKLYGRLGFGPGDRPRGRKTLAAIIEGRFESFYKGKPSPLAAKKKEDAVSPTSVIEKSPESARIILFASNEFLTDQVLRRSAMGGSERYLNSLQVIENAVDWSLEDRGLLAIRSRGRFSKTLPPLSQKARLFWEYLNYALAFAGLAFVFLLHRFWRRRLMRGYDGILRLEGV